jgi:PAS domain S-box-containing protein
MVNPSINELIKEIEFLKKKLDESESIHFINSCSQILLTFSEQNELSKSDLESYQLFCETVKQTLVFESVWISKNTPQYPAEFLAGNIAFEKQIVTDIINLEKLNKEQITIAQALEINQIKIWEQNYIQSHFSIYQNLATTAYEYNLIAFSFTLTNNQTFTFQAIVNSQYTLQPSQAEHLRAIVINTFKQITYKQNITHLQNYSKQLIKENKKIKHHEKFLSAILENIPDMIFLKDSEHLRFEHFNLAGEKLLGYKRDELIGKNDFDFFPEEQAKAFILKDREALNNKNNITIEEEKIDTIHGTRILHTVKLALLDENGNPTHLLGISKDITNKKIIEQELSESRKIAEENTRILKENYQELLTTEEELRSSNEALQKTSEKLKIKIDELKIAGKKSAKSEALLQNITDCLPAYIAEVDINTLKFTFVNQPFARLLSKTKEQILDSTLSEIWGEEELQKDLPNIEKVKNGKLTSYVKEYISKNQKYHLQINYTPVYNSEEELITFIILAHDISEQIQASNELINIKNKAIKSNANIQAILENTTSRIWAIDRDYRIVYINQIFKDEYELHFGIKLDIGSHIVDSLPKELQSVWKARYDRVFQNEQFIIEDQIPFSPDNIVYIQISMNPISVDGNVIGASFFGKNVSKQKQAELEIIKAKEAAEESEYRFKTLHNASFGGIAIHDKGLILDCNQGLSDITEYSHEELVNSDGLRLIAPESLALVMNKITQKVTTPYEAVGLKKSGKKYPLRIEARMIPYKGKKVRVTEFRDITYEKEVEQELVKAKEAAEENEKLKSAFLQNMSHEIRTPLNAICGFSQMLEKDELSKEKRKSFISIILNGSNQLLSIVNDVLTISALETNQEEIKEETFSVNFTLMQMLQVFEPLAQKQNLKLYTRFALSDKLAMINTDKVKFTQIFHNLISNSLKFTDKGYVEFGYTLENNIENNMQYYQFFVKDSGIGIDINVQHKIFDRFVQADKTIQTNYGGNGLGLAISKGFIELMGGNIWVESQAHIGTTFYFTLPIFSQSRQNQAIAEEVFKMQTKKILVAEDEKFNYLFLEEILHELSLDVLHAKTGKECIAIFQANKDIHLILMDIKMPDMDGYEATIEIKKINPQVKVIAQSAYALEHEIIRYGGIFDDYFTKPIDAQKLINLLKDNYL